MKCNDSKQKNPQQNRFYLLCICLSLTFTSLLLFRDAFASDEEFNGPFSSWLDLKQDYGAIGDGKADDTAALQKALDELVLHKRSNVLFVPSGKYRITRTLKTSRTSHQTGQGITLVGENPETTVLSWDGASGETMFKWDAWYSKISRLTLDGQGKAGTGLQYGPAFSTYNETSDMFFKDMAICLLFGGKGYKGQAENEVLRSRFLRCKTGIKTAGWNSMDIWVWYSRFEDNGRAIFNEKGNWHAWQNLFLRSRIADMSSDNLMVFSVVNNTSIGSRSFFDFTTGHTWGSPVSITGNQILDPTGDWAISLGNSGPYLLMDNVFRLKEGRAVKMTWGVQTLIANQYNRPDSVHEDGHFRRIDEKIVKTSDMAVDLPVMPDTPPYVKRQIFDVPAGADDVAIQSTIDLAAKHCGEHPVVHLSAGTYDIRNTLSLPADCNLQLVGDGVETATRLIWNGQKGGTLLVLKGPSKATLRDFSLRAAQGRALLVDNADQKGGKIFADQLNVSGPGNSDYANNRALFVNGIGSTKVQLRAFQGSGLKGTWLEVAGDKTGQNYVTVLTGASASARRQFNIANNGKLLVRAVYHERSANDVTAIRLAGAGSLVVDTTRFSMATTEGEPTILVDGFTGELTIVTSMLLPVESEALATIQLQGNGETGSVLILDNLFWAHKPDVRTEDIWRDTTTPPITAGFAGNTLNSNRRLAAFSRFKFVKSLDEDDDIARSISGAGLLSSSGDISDEQVLKHVSALRKMKIWLPENSANISNGITDVRIHRVMASGGIDSTVEFRAQ